MNARSLIVSCLLFVMPWSCTGEAEAKVDPSSPQALAESIFAIAAGGSLAELRGIAAEDADGDSKRVAGIAEAEVDKQEEFRSYFGKGKVHGDVTIEGDRASVPILFGPDGTKPETLEMVRKDGRWFLSSF